MTRPVSTAAGALAGYAASRTMDAATTWFYGRQSDESKVRENELAPGGALVQVGKQLGRTFGRDLDDEEAGRIGLAVHRTLGVGYGIAAARLIGRGVPPLVAGVAVGTAGLVLVDEGLRSPSSSSTRWRATSEASSGTPPWASPSASCSPSWRGGDRHGPPLVG